MIIRLFATVVLLATVSLLTPGDALAQQTTTGATANRSTTGTLQGQRGVKPADQPFVINAAHGGLMEVTLGQLTVQKASNAEVKAFGQRMVDDHTKVNDQLKQVAQSKGIVLPTTMKAEHTRMMNRLQKLSGAKYDQAYMQHMVADHRKDVAEFEKEVKKGSDPEVKQFAENTLPVLREHLQQAESVLAKLPKPGRLSRQGKR